MRKLLILFLLLVLVITISSDFAFSINYPSPTGYVNDFADIIPEQMEDKIKARISDYDKQTSIEIAVVTTKSLEGLSVEEWTIGLATQWGVGKNSKDNGLVFAIAPNERKMRIEVGYGLEGDMNDAKAGRILDDYAIPYFKQGDYANGIEKTTEAIMNTLGRMSIQERNEARAQRLKQEQEMAKKEAEERRIQAAKAKEAFQNFMSGLLVLAVIVGIFFSIFCIVKAISKAIKEHNRKKALRKLIMRDISNIRENMSRLKKRINEAEKKSASFPKWAFSIADSRLKDASLLLLGIELKSYSLIERDIRKDPDKANKTLLSIKENISKVEGAIALVEVDIPKEIKNYEELASQELANTENLLAEADSKLSKAKGEGLFLDGGLDKILKEAKEGLGKNGECFSSDKSKARDICSPVDSIKEKILIVIGKIGGIIETRSETEKILQILPDKAGRIEKEKQKYEEILEGMKKAYPEDNWKDIFGSFMLVAGLITLSRNLTGSARKNNSVEQQRFYDANSEALKAKENLDKAESIFASIAERKIEIEQAKQNHAAELSKAELKVKKSLEKVKDSDVGESAKNKAKEAEAKLKEAKGIIGAGGMINWLLVILMIATAIKLAGEAETEAGDDIDAAEEARKKAEEEKKRRVAAAAALASPRPSITHTSHFSGFGGGGFGGGGASRSW